MLRNAVGGEPDSGASVRIAIRYSFEAACRPYLVCTIDIGLGKFTSVRDKWLLALGQKSSRSARLLYGLKS